MLDRLKNMFGSGGSFVTVHAPFKGTLINLDEVDDQIFKTGTLGPGFAVRPDPTEHILKAPVGGQVITIAQMAHAIMIKTIGDAEILIHLGLGTVSLKGEGFKTLIKNGDFIKVGDPLIEFDQKVIAAHNLDTVTPVVIPNPGQYTSYEQIAAKQELLGLDEVFNLIKKD